MKGFVLKIFHKILLGNLLIALVPLAGLFFLINTAQQDRLAGAENELRLEAASMSRDITRWAEMNRRLLSQNSLSANMQSMQTARQKPILDNILKSYEWTFLVYTVGNDGYMTARSDDQSILKPDGSSAHFRGDRDYFEAILDKQPIGQSVVVSRTIGMPVYVMCVPLDGPKLQQINALCTASKLGDVSESVTSIKLGETGYASLISDKNQLIASGKKHAVSGKELQDLSDHPILAQSKLNQLYTFEEDGKKVVSYAVEAGFGWKLVVQQDYDEAFASVTSAMNKTWIIVALTVLAIVLLAMSFSREISRVMKELTALADDYSKGVFDSENSSLERKDELGDLARAIDRMGKSIRLAISKLSNK